MIEEQLPPIIYQMKMRQVNIGFEKITKTNHTYYFNPRLNFRLVTGATIRGNFSTVTLLLKSKASFFTKANFFNPESEIS